MLLSYQKGKMTKGLMEFAENSSKALEALDKRQQAKQSKVS